jgi:two-component system chemotaxis response regulator CheB
MSECLSVGRHYDPRFENPSIKGTSEILDGDNRRGAFIYGVVKARARSYSDAFANYDRTRRTDALSPTTATHAGDSLTMSASAGPRAVVVDDSHFMRTLISDVLERGGVDVVDEARNGSEAVDVVDECDPDVVTMDYEMPEMNGVEAVERIMARTPTPVVMLSAHTDENADVTFEALERGAVDFFTKPGGEVSTNMTRHEDQLVEKVRVAAEAEVGRARTQNVARTTRRRSAGYVDNPTLIVGSSTGGPTEVEHVLASLPRAADLRVLVVQHMPDWFTGRFADRLDRNSDYRVWEASDGDRVGAGDAVVAKGGSHLEIANYAGGRLRLRLTDGPSVNGVKPAVDVTMESASEVIDDPLVGVVLTGMGRDGADGVRAMKRAGAATIAQNERTATVFGMPKQAIATGCVDDVLPTDDIPDAILDAITEDDA